TIFAQSMDRTGYARGTLATQVGLTAPVPAIDPRPLIAMSDMGMDHASMGGMDHGSMGADSSATTPAMNHGNMGDMGQASMAGMAHGAMGGMQHGSMAGMGHGAMPGMAGAAGMAMQTHPASEANNPLVDMQTM